MKPLVTALVIANGNSEFLSVTLAGLRNQTRQPDRIFIVDTSAENSANSVVPTEVEQHEFAQGATLVHAGPVKNLGAAIAMVAPLALDEAGATDWLWLLHDDSAPTKSALAELLNVVEISPSVVQVGPKLLEWNDPRYIQQLGLTLTKRLALFSPVAGELDQSQHDHFEDVLAVGTAAMLIRTDVYQQLGGFDAHAPALAADVDFSIRVRLAGHRVAVAPQAKVAHAALAMAGKRPRRWLGASPRTARRRATAHLRVAYAPFWTALATVAFAPVLGILAAIWAIAAKHPNRIWAELSTGFWTFLTGFARLAARGRVRRNSVLQFKQLAALRATSQQVRQQRLAEIVREDSELGAEAAPLLPEGAVAEQSEHSKLVLGSAIWWVVGLAALSAAFWPIRPAAIGGGLLPLSSNWYQLFTHAGTSYQDIGLGFFGPSDPFNWVLLALGSLTPWQPSLGLAVFLFLAKSLAFLGAWRAVGLLTAKRWLRALAALAYALWPALNIAQAEGRLPALVAAVALPWFVLAVARAAGLGKNAPARSAARTWSWVGVSGLLLMVIGVAAPNVLPALFLALAVVLFSRLRKFRYLFWIPLPLGAAIAPLIWFESVGLLQPLAPLADPGLPLASPLHQFWQLLLGGGVGFDVSAGWQTTVSSIANLATIAVLLVALLALLGKRFVFATSLWLLVLASVASAWLVERIDFAAVGVGSSAVALERVNGSPYALLALAALGVLALAVNTVEQINRRWLVRGIAATLALATCMPLAASVAISEPAVSFGDGRVVPSLVAAEAGNGSQLKTLVLREVGDAGSAGRRISAELVSGDGIQLDDVSLAYRFALADLAYLRAEYDLTGQLVADLVAANGTELTTALQDAGVGYVLAPEVTSKAGRSLAIALDSAVELESAGQTEYGRLWRVKTPDPKLVAAPESKPSPWSITKVIQLVVVIGFILLAVPGRGTGGKRRESDIFIDQTDEPTGGEQFA